MFVLGFSLSQLSCNRSETFDVVKVQKAIEASCARYSEAIREGNVAGIIDLYTDDASIVPPDGDVVKGRQAIGEFYKQLLQIGMKDIAFTTIEVGGCDGTAYEIGKTKILIQPEGQAAFQDSSKYMVIWKRQADATWKVHADIWNIRSQMAGK